MITNAPGTPTAPGPAGPANFDGSNTLFPHTIGADTPDPNAPVAPAPVEPTHEQLAQQARDAQFEQLMQSNQQMLQMLMQQRSPQGQTQPAAPQAPPAFTLEGLPDAVSAPKDFTTQLAQRIQQRDAQLGQYITQNVTAQVARGAAMDGVFNRFQMQHSDLAKKGALLQGAAITEFQALQAQGIDPVSVAQQNPDSLVARIAARMQSELGVAPTGAAPGPVGQQHGAPLTAYSAPTQPNASRVAGIQGGSGMPATPRAPAPPRGFVDQLNDARKASGLV